jgi:FdhD protein
MPISPLGPVPGLGYSQPFVTRALTHLSDGSGISGEAAIAEEIPVAFVYNGESFVVVMASPTDLDDLAVGFSITEGVVANVADIERIDTVRHSRGIELQMVIPPADAERLSERRRGMNARTGCGLCGVESIDEVLRPPRVVTSQATFAREALWRASAELDTRQPVNSETRAVHAAAFADGSGALIVVREDVGRHNALDKVIGALARSSSALDAGFLVVTSRASYELVQKAATAGAPLLAAISRPTSLAIELADQAHITLVGLLRGRSANVYSHPERLAR